MRSFSVHLIVIAMLLPACKQEAAKETTKKPEAKAADESPETTDVEVSTESPAKGADSEETPAKGGDAPGGASTDGKAQGGSTRVLTDGASLLSTADLAKVTYLKVKAAYPETATNPVEFSVYVDFTTGAGGLIAGGIDKKRPTPMTEGEKKIILGALALIKVKKVTDCAAPENSKGPGSLVELKIGSEVLNIAAAGTYTCNSKTQFYLGWESINSIFGKILQGQVKMDQ